MKLIEIYNSLKDIERLLTCSIIFHEHKDEFFKNYAKINRLKEIRFDVRQALNAFDDFFKELFNFTKIIKIYQ